MSIASQILIGAILLGLCGGVHVASLALGVRFLTRFGRSFSAPGGVRQSFWVMGAAFAIIVFAHSVEVWIWALALRPMTEFASFEQTLYFSLVSYTTLGYGDVVLGPEARLFAAMSAVTGLLTFGLSTAFLVAVLANLPAFKSND